MPAKKQSPTDKSVIFAELEKTDVQKVRIWYNVFKNMKLYCIQNFWRENPTDNWRFGKAITFHPEDIDKIISALTDMREWYEENAATFPVDSGLE